MALNLPASLFTKVGSYEIMKTNLSKLPVTILPENSILDVASGNDVNTLGTFRPDTSDTFSISMEITRTSWSAPVSDVELYSIADEIVDNGIRVFQAGTSGLLTVQFRDDGNTTASLTYDITGAASGKHTITIARVSATTQDLYVDGVLADSDTDATDTIGTPKSTVVGTGISAIAKTNPAKITTSGAHGLSSGDVVVLSGIVGSQTMNARKNKGMESMNGKTYAITKVDATSFTIIADATNFDTYSSGGVVNFTEPLVSTYITGTVNKLITLNKLDANDAEILYQLTQNNLVVRDANGLIKTVTLV